MKYKKWNMQYEVVELKKYGIDNIAFDLPSAVSYMYEAVNNGLLILGGDIIVYEHGVFVESNDSWYSIKKQPMDTMQDALDYLSSYWNNCGKDTFPWYIAIVLGT